MNPRPISFDAAIALGGTPGRDDVFLSWALERSRVVVAADVGADRVLEVGHVPDWVIGDFDSFDGRQLSRDGAHASVCVR
jgi:thiamine pyrophosphokinase